MRALIVCPTRILPAHQIWGWEVAGRQLAQDNQMSNSPPGTTTSSRTDPNDDDDDDTNVGGGQLPASEFFEHSGVGEYQ